MAIMDETMEQATPPLATLTPNKPDAMESCQSLPRHRRTFQIQTKYDRGAVKTAIKALLKKRKGSHSGKIDPLTPQMLLDEREAKIQFRERNGNGSARNDFPLQYNEARERMWLINEYASLFRKDGKGVESEDDEEPDEAEDNSEDEDGIKAESDDESDDEEYEDADMDEAGPKYHATGTAVSAGKFITTKIPEALLAKALGTSSRPETVVARVATRGRLDSGTGSQKRVWRVVGGKPEVWPPFDVAMEPKSKLLGIKRKAYDKDFAEGGMVKRARA